ncbi:SCO family protein [Blastococcus capsensis]|nr:SCO family protein [Blastococcus capsensis]
MSHSRARGAAAALVAAGLLVAGCGAGDTSSAPATVSAAEDVGSSFRGTALSEPMPLTDAAASAVFTTAAGGTTTLGELQQDRVMLVFFGYTHCPDVCPTTMADLGIALQRTPEQVQERSQVVFITSDPERDTPAVLTDWLDHFDSGLATPFVGLTAAPEQVTAVAESMGVSLSPPQVGPDGTVTVQHGAQTLAFVDGRAGLVWTSGSTSEDYRVDLARLVGDL